MAAIRFPKVPHFKDPTESQIDVCDHLTAVKKRKIGRGINEPPEVTTEARDVTFDSTTNKIFLVESNTIFRIGSDIKSCISIFSKSGELLYTFKSKQIKNPFGIAVDGDNIYLTDIELHCVFHFKMVPYFHLVATEGKRGTGEEEFNSPYQLAVSIHGDILLADCLNHRIKIINRFLKYKSHISHYSMTRPCDVKLTPVSVYVLSSEDSPCVHVFSYTGEKIRSLITSRSIGTQVVSPICFCLDADENLIICDNWVGEVKIFSKKGTLLHVIGEKGDGVGELNNPHAMTIINNRKIAVVSQNKDYDLQIFSYL